jgi:uncharacterized protein (DUF1684 family)
MRPTGKPGGHGTLRLLVLVLLLSATACENDTPRVETVEEYAQRIAALREARVERLRTSWLTVAGLYWLAAGDNPFGRAETNAIVFPADVGPEVAGSFNYRDGEVLLQPAPGAGLTVDGAPAREMLVSADPEPEQIGLGRLTFFVIERGGKHAIRLRDPEFRALKNFHGIDYYPADPAYAIEGRWIPHDEPTTRSVETVIGIDAEMVSTGRVEFDLGGRTHSLDAFDGSGEELFLIFKDATTGRETYDGGRYLYAKVEGGRVVLDFNLAYNPPCAFTPYATCPLPPPGNALDVGIAAGERSYHSTKVK